MIARRAWARTTSPRRGGPRSPSTAASSRATVATPMPSGPRWRIVSSIRQPASELTGLRPMMTPMPHISAPLRAQVLVGEQEVLLRPAPGERLLDAAPPDPAHLRPPLRRVEERVDAGREILDV